MGVFKLAGLTLRSLFSKPDTLCYPFQTKTPPEGLKGHITIDENHCILCGICARSCTTGAISVSKPERTWSIERLRCVQCGYCALMCPKSCLAMDPTYAPVATEKAPVTITVPEQEKPAKKEAVKE